MSQALILFSGGLDSMLAVCVLREQGVAVRGIAYDSPFFSARQAAKSAAQLGLELETVDFSSDILSLLKHPPHGFGKGMNPCIDCHALMFKRASERIDPEREEFLASGEVLNERPMSQTWHNLARVARASGCERWIVRPLSARRLPPSEPELRGWVDRERLLAFEGRSRRPQFRLAARYGIGEYPTPAGGCRLTEPRFSERLRDLLDRIPSPTKRDLQLLRVGRHSWPAPHVRLVVGRDERDNEAIEALATSDDLVILPAPDVPGPTGLLIGSEDESVEAAALSIWLRYSSRKAGDTQCVTLLRNGTVIRRRFLTRTTSGQPAGLIEQAG